MPAPGGPADKFGNRYETLWAIDRLLRIVDAAAMHLTLEPLDRDESRGIEFTVDLFDGSKEYWSVKRQTTRASGWTLGLLSASDGRGRAILSDLITHAARGDSHRGVFASTLGAPELEELRLHAATKEVFEGRLTRSNDLRSGFLEYVVPLCDGDRERARTLLVQLQTHASDETQLRERVNFTIRKLFYATNGARMDEDAVRGYLSDLLLDQIHRPIDRQTILQALASHSIGVRDWALDPSVRQRLEELCERYASPLRSELIQGSVLPLEGAEPLQTVGQTSGGRRVLVVAGAGAGKSSTLVHLMEQLRASGIAVLPVRFDQLPEGILSTRELGAKLLLPESPALSLAGVSEGGRSVLVVDQLDAVSSASGRKTEMWTVFDDLEREVRRVPNMSIVVGCREFDLEHDPRIRGLSAEGQGFEIVKLGALSEAQLESALRAGGTNPDDVQAALKPILRVPLHLALFLRLPSEMRTHIRNHDELFGKFWIETERKVDLRLGRKAAWTQVIDQLSNWLSEKQELAAPRYVLDEFSADAAAMASEHFLVLAENKYRFFHESLFDYAYARRFSAKGGRIIDLLLGSEQHLFRRAQVRQILAFLRAEDRPRYLQEVQSVLVHAQVRFHVKRLLFQWLSSLTDPQLDEWQILQNAFSQVTELRNEFLSITTGRVGWFDVLDEAGFFDAALSSGDEQKEREAIWLMGIRGILEERSRRVSKLFRKHEKPGVPWRQYLRLIVRSGDVFHSREMFDLFLSHIDDGSLDGARPGVAVNDNWWSLLYGLTEKRPDLACEAIAHWFDRHMAIWRTEEESKADSAGEGASSVSLASEFNRDGQHFGVVGKASAAALSYATEMLPRIAQVATATANEYPGRLQVDPLWCHRSFGDTHYWVHEDLYAALAKALEEIARTAPEKLDALLAPVEESPCEAVAFLVLRAWTAAPERYADRLARYLASEPRRLKIGYQSAGSGSYENYVSTEAVRAASAKCSSDQLEALEQAIVDLKDDWEAKNPPFRGLRQLDLLRAMDISRLSASGKAKLAELERKFPETRYEKPEEGAGGFVGSPIPEVAQTKMTDKQWLSAMEKYAGTGIWTSRKRGLSGGEQQLALGLMSRAKKDPGRFRALADQMPDTASPSYFDAIVRGVSEAVESRGEADPQSTAQECAALVRRVHALPGRPCGRALAWLFTKGQNLKWPKDVVEVLAWYAVRDPDPRPPEESPEGRPKDAFEELLQPELFEQLQDAVHSGANDPSLPVRSCAVLALLASLNVAPGKAVSWFLESISDQPSVLGTRYAGQFVHYATYRDERMWPVLERMLDFPDDRVLSTGAQEICLLGLDVEKAGPLVERVETGSTSMRVAAANAYARHVSHETVGAICRRRIKRFFEDPEESVRVQAGTAFQYIASLDTFAQADLLEAFLQSKPGPLALIPVVRALGNSTVQLPDLVCRLAELCVEAYRDEAGDITKSASGIAMDLSKVVIRLYAQTRDAAIQSRCLSMIDEMERSHFLELAEELQRVER